MEKFIFLAFLDVLFASLLMFQPIICSSNFTDQEALLHFKLATEVDPTTRSKVAIGLWKLTSVNGRQQPQAESHDFRPLLHRSPVKSLSLPWQSLILGFSLIFATTVSMPRFQIKTANGGISREFGAFPKLQQQFSGFNNLQGQILSFLGSISTDLGSGRKLALWLHTGIYQKLLNFPTNSSHSPLSNNRSHSQLNGFLEELDFLQLSDNNLDGNILSSIGGLQQLAKAVP
ncbi:uncharacterized protein LOC130137884 [Syzygium oleosum]|uniref:uncharacterized protein LOC130137884 n=1 Tax=Syzygium oleosum TaxID=219896 RepID=UPI0024B89BC8|nr:uncharacterized protein LOC130137884 [Syzygium oleosum]